MKPLKPKVARTPRPRKSLTTILGQSQQVGELVREFAEDLSSVNASLKHEIAGQEPSTRVIDALGKNEAIERKVGEASEQLAAVTAALEHEVRDRLLLEHQFAAVTEQEEAARHASFHDSLTGLPTRSLFNDRLEHGMAQAKRHQWSLAVMYLDLDGFKSINDQHGHDVGDGVLKVVAQRLRETTRSDDTVSRIGGDEFLYLLVEMPDEATVAMIAEKIIVAIQEPMRISVRNLELDLVIRASVGISVSPRHGNCPHELVRSADLAMYQAKRSKSGYSFASDGADR
jgi:diguanylate cyclase